MEILAEQKLSDKEYAALTAQAANYRTILRFLKAGGLDDFLARTHVVPLDIELTPDDLTGGNSINLFLKSLADECNRMDQKITSLSQALVDSTISLTKIKRSIQVQGMSLRQRLLSLFKR